MGIFGFVKREQLHSGKRVPPMKTLIKFAATLVLTLPVMVQAVDYPATNVTINIPSNQQVLVSDAYETTNNTINELFAGLPSGSTVSLWNNTSQSWTHFDKTRTGWGVGGTVRLTIGTAAIIWSPIATNVHFSGAVPSAVSTAVYKVNGYTWIGYPYPADVAFTNTEIARTADNGEKILFWTNNSWVVYSKIRTGWVPSATNLVLKNCGTFAYWAYTNAAVYEIRPY